MSGKNKQSIIAIRQRIGYNKLV